MILIGQKIKDARKEKKLTQEELADSNISRSLISLIENDLSYPSMQTLEYHNHTSCSDVFLHLYTNYRISLI